MPEVDIYGFANLGLQYAAGGRVATSYQIADEVNWTRGGAWRFSGSAISLYGGLSSVFPRSAQYVEAGLCGTYFN